MGPGKVVVLHVACFDRPTVCACTNSYISNRKNGKSSCGIAIRFGNGTSFNLGSKHSDFAKFFGVL
jgi:hypothetical protein